MSHTKARRTQRRIFKLDFLYELCGSVSPCETFYLVFVTIVPPCETFYQAFVTIVPPCLRASPFTRPVMTRLE